MGGRGAVVVAVVMSLGLMLGRASAWPPWVIPCMEVLAAGVAFAAAVAGRSTPRATPFVLLALALAATARGAAQDDRLERLRRGIPREGGWFRLSAHVAEPPADATSAPLVILTIDGAEPALPHGARVRVRCPDATTLEWGDRVTGLAWLDVPDPPRNPGGFDGVRFAAANSLIGSGRFVWCHASRSSGISGVPRATFGRWRSALERRLSAGLTEHARAIVWPLVLGDRSELPLALSAELRVAGLVHLIALSGLHVAWLAELARTFAAVAGAGVRGRAVASALCAVVYAGLAGPIPSLARAAVSELLGAGAVLGSRRLDPVQAVGLSAVLLLAVFPAWIDDLGFQLSCTATIGLVTLGQWRPALPSGLRVPLGALISTLGAQVVSMPLVLASFHLLAWVAPAANLLAVPIAGWLLSSAWLALLADMAVPGAGRQWFSACEILCRALEWVVSHAASIPGAAAAACDDLAVSAMAALGAVLLVWAAVHRRPPAAEPRREPPVLPSALIGLTLCACALVLAAWGNERRPSPGRTWLVFLDVGQGDAIGVGFPDGWWLVDAGAAAARFDAGEQVVVPFLRWAGVRRLDGLVITHDDSDHCGGAPAVCRGVPVRRIYTPAPLVGQSPPLERFHGVAVRDGRRLHAQPPLDVLWPPAAGSSFVPARGTTPDNAGGVVLRCGAGTSIALLMADVDSTVESLIPVAVPVSVLKAGHHGSASSTGAAFLRRADPLHVVLSCGRRNRFGHPAPATLARLAATRARIERTDVSGAIWYELDDRGARRIDWPHGEIAAAGRAMGSVTGGTVSVPRCP